jgi:phosphopantothenoylcysteine synthetase/decarboxylase
MNILITSGSTITMIDKVRGITNIFRGRTGFEIATAALLRGHSVTLLANSIAEEWVELMPITPEEGTLEVCTYKTFDDLEQLMRQELGKRKYDACIHSAAVSDYKVNGVFKDSATVLGFLNHTPLPALYEISNPSGKIGSKLDELWLRLTPTTKLVDHIREWGLGDGKLVKFKLEVNVSPEELFNRASKSREESNADLIVANRLDDFSDWAAPSMQIIDRENNVIQVSRKEMPGKLLDMLK